MSKIIDINEIQKYLPHRYPFLLVDRVISVDKGKTLTAIKNVTFNEPFFLGHFPVSPVMPGVLIVEALAQASGVLIFETIGRYPDPEEIFYLAGINSTRFKRMVVPGDVLQLDIELLKHGHGLWKFKGTASVEGEVACITEFMNINATKEKRDSDNE